MAKNNAGTIAPTQVASIGLAPSKTKAAKNPPKPLENIVAPANNDEYRKQYQVMHLGVGIPGSPRHERMRHLEAMADEIGVSSSTLVWNAIYNFLDSPPDSLREDVETQGTGSASGYWLVVDRNQDGTAKGTRIVKVSSRGQVGAEGQTFFRFDPSDENSVGRAERAAQRAEVEMRKLFGFEPKKEQTVEDLSTDALKSPA